MKKLTLILTILALGAVFGADALAADSPSPQQQQFSLAAQPAVKITLRGGGWYSVSRKELVAAGLNPLAEARLLQLYTDGEQVPVLVRGVKKGHLAADGSVEFYGRGRNIQSTDSRTYWLVVGSNPGKRIAVVPTPRGRGASRARSFSFTSVHRDRINYYTFRSGNRSHFYGKLLNPSSVPLDQTIVVQDLDPRSTKASLRVAMHGITFKPHKIKLVLNGTELSTMMFDGQVEAAMTVPVPATILKEGSNVLTLTATAGELDFSLVDELDLTYGRQYQAQDDFLNFTVPERQRAFVNGFTKSQIRLVDITRSDEPRVMVPVTQRSNNAFALKIGATGQAHRYLSLAAAQVKHAASVVAERPSAWHEDSHGADLLIISNREFMGALQPLKALRERQGLKVGMVDVQDVYDEFAFGARGPAGIKSFVMWTRAHWHPAPRFLLLVGDSTLDPRNFLGKNEPDFVPTKFLSTSLLETASDGWFGDANGDGVPEIAIGRLPARTRDEAQTMVSKIVGYDELGRSTPGSAYLVADSDGQIDFNTPVDQLRGFFPSSFSIEVARRSDGPSDAAVRKRLFAGLNSGPSVVNYFGHGAIDLWSQGGLFQTKDAVKLTNGRNLSLYVMMSCINGYFVDPSRTSLAEGLLEAVGGGAVAVIASSGVTNAGPQPALNQAFLQILFANPTLSIGQALNEAKRTSSDNDLRKTQLLFGDPTTRLHY